MTLLRHPYSGRYYDDRLIYRYAKVDLDREMSFDEAVDDLVLRVGFERVWPESDIFDGIDDGVLSSTVVATTLVENIGRIADNTGRLATRLEILDKQSPHTTTDQPKGISVVIPDAIYTVEEFAGLVRISLSEAHALTQPEGPIPCMRIGRSRKIKRVLGRDILAYLESSKDSKLDTKYQLKHLG